MQFITDYLTLIIKNKNYYKDGDKMELIRRLSNGSRLCILDGDGNASLVGEWVEEGGCYYSNTSYKPREKKSKYNKYSVYGWLDEWDDAPQVTTDGDGGDEYERFYNTSTGLYELDPLDCPATEKGAGYYCEFCACYKECYGINREEVYGG